MRAVFELMRPFTLLMPVLSFIAAALVALGASPRPPLCAACFIPVLAGALSMALMAGAANSLNQIFDVREDSINKPFRPLPSGRASSVTAWIVTLLLAAAAWSLSAYTPLATRFMALLILAGIVVYSVPPLRTKGRGWWANFTIAFARGFLLRLAGWAVMRSALSFEAWLLSGVFMLFLMGAASTKDFADLPGDQRFGVGTLVVRLGPRRAARQIAPFFALPWLLLVVGAQLGWLSGNAWLLQTLGLGLAGWGAWVAIVLLPRTERGLDGNHVSWRHMYLMLMTADVGLAIAYGARIILG